MADLHEQIKEIEEAMSKAKYNKATEHWFGLMMSKVAQLRRKLEQKAAKKGAGRGFFVKKSGDATVVIVGFPSVGKSTLLNALTGAKSKTAAYEFTTLDVVPGILHYNNAKIQILDVPGVLSGAAYGRGRGKEVLAMARNADLLLFVIDALHPEHYPVLLKEVHDVGIRVNQSPPDIKITPKIRGGISIYTTKPLTKVSKETLEAVLKEFKCANADVVIREDIDLDRFIDAIEANRAYIPALVVLSKIDLLNKSQLAKVTSMLPGALPVSAEKGIGVEELKEAIFNALHFVRIYLKEVGKKPDLDEPLVLKSPATLQAVCEHIHRDFVKKFRFARVWGKSAKFPGQQFRKLDKVLEDGDIVEIHIQ